MIALNGIFILEPYKQGQGIRGEMVGGLFVPGQRHNLVGLKMLVDSKVEGTLFKAGSIAYLQEDFLSTNDAAKRVKKADGIVGEFIQIESRHIVMVKPNEQ